MHACFVTAGLKLASCYAPHRVAQSAAFFRTNELEPWSRRSTSGLKSLAISALHTHRRRFIVPEATPCRWSMTSNTVCSGLLNHLAAEIDAAMPPCPLVQPAT